MLLQLFLVLDDGNLLRDLRGNRLEVCDFLLRFRHDIGGPELATSGNGAPFAGNVVLLDVGTYSVYIFELEPCDFGAAVKEKGLAVAAVLDLLSALVCFM